MRRQYARNCAISSAEFHMDAREDLRNLAPMASDRDNERIKQTRQEAAREYIQIVLDTLNMKPTHLAELIDVHPSTINRPVSGAPMEHAVSVGNLLKIREKTNVKFTDFRRARLQPANQLHAWRCSADGAPGEPPVACEGARANGPWSRDGAECPRRPASPKTPARQARPGASHGNRTRGARWHLRTQYRRTD